MGFAINVITPAGYAATYAKLTAHKNDKEKKELTAEFKFYKDKATADAGGAPACQQVGRIRLNGATYEEWFGSSAKTKASGEGKTIDDAAIVYRAARRLGLICDFGDHLYLPKKNPEDDKESPRTSGYKRLFMDAVDA